MCHSGYLLKVHKKSAKQSMEDFFLIRGKKSNDLDYKRDVLSGRIDDVSVTPYGLFEVSRSNLLGVKATLMTYIIVLLQFRAA